MRRADQRPPDHDPVPPSADHRPLLSDEIPLAATSEAAQAADAELALRYLTRVGAGDLAECLGLVA